MHATLKCTKKKNDLVNLPIHRHEAEDYVYLAQSIFLKDWLLLSRLSLINATNMIAHRQKAGYR